MVELWRRFAFRYLGWHYCRILGDRYQQNFIRHVKWCDGEWRAKTELGRDVTLLDDGKLKTIWSEFTGWEPYSPCELRPTVRPGPFQVRSHKEF